MKCSNVKCGNLLNIEIFSSLVHSSDDKEFCSLECMDNHYEDKQLTLGEEFDGQL